MEPQSKATRAMLRLLQDADEDGTVAAHYYAQYATLFKAQRLGLIDDDFMLTEAGKAWVARKSQS